MANDDCRISFDERARLLEDQKRLHLIMDLLKVDKCVSYKIVDVVQDMLAEHDEASERLEDVQELYTNLKHRYGVAVSAIKRLSCLLGILLTCAHMPCRLSLRTPLFLMNLRSIWNLMESCSRAALLLIALLM